MLNKFFKSASERYNKLCEKNYLINPMSEIDLEIVGELKVVLDKVGLNEVNEILKNYKEYKDIEIFETLLNWNIEHPKVNFLKNKGGVQDMTDGSFDEQPRPAFISIGDAFIRDFDIKGFQLIDEIRNGEEFYAIKINPTPDDVLKLPYWANHIVPFSDIESRDETLLKLKNYLSSREIDIIEL
jgi:hypothetical protein